MRYVALGDSYAAGVGGAARRNVCWRADDGYPVQVARRLGLAVAYNACLGAVVADVVAHQLAPLGTDTTHISITVGGNDIGFVPVLIAAAEPGWMANSDVSIDHALIAMRQVLPGRLDFLFAEVTGRAPNAYVVATAYPRLFNGVDCNLATFFSPHEMERLNAAADELGSVIAARRAGIRYAGVGTRFAGHAGEAVGEAEIVEGPCVPGSAPTFSLPDLLSARSLDGAREYGLDPGEVERLARQLYAGLDATQGAARPSEDTYAAAARLAELDAIARERRGEVKMDG